MRPNIISDLLAILAPHACVVCDRSIRTGLICLACADLSRLWITPERCCKICSIAFQEPALTCPRCAASPLLVESVRALVWYRDSSAWLIRAAKYKPSLALMRLLARLLAQHCAALMRNLPEADLIVAIPSSRTSLNQRGFNQSQILGQAVAAAMGLPLRASALKIRKHFTRRALLARNKRSLNLAGAFRASTASVAGKRVLLIDDIVTSGATAAAATRALRRSGAASVQLLCFARAPGDLTYLRCSKI